jgi:uncharacterized protein (TIGR03083 family)
MGLTRTDTIEQLEGEWATLETFVRAISDADMDRPTRCEEWTVRGVIAHIVGGVLDVAGGTVGTTTGHQYVEDRSTHSPSQLADELHDGAQIAMKLLRTIDDRIWAQPSPFPGLTVRQGVEALWLESFLHEDDIRDALGMTARSSGGLALEISIRHVAEEMAKHAWNQTTLALDGMPKVRIGPGGDSVIGGDPMQFLLAATGRIGAEDVGLDPKVNIYRR